MRMRGEQSWGMHVKWGDGGDLSGQDMAYQEVGQHVEGGQGQDSGPQVPLLRHGNDIKSPI